MTELNRDVIYLMLDYFTQAELRDLLLLNWDFNSMITEYLERTPFVLINNERDLRQACIENLVISINRIYVKLNWNWALYGACGADNEELVALAVRKGARNWHDAFSHACASGNISIVKFLEKKGCFRWNVGLMFACVGGHRDLVEYFLAKGAKYYTWGLKGAAFGGHIDIAEFMIKKGAKIDFSVIKETLIGRGGKKMYDYIFRKAVKRFNLGSLALACNSRNIDIVKDVVANISDEEIQTIPTTNNGILANACSSGNKEVIDYVISLGATDWNIGLIGACHGGHLDIVKYMIEKGAQISILTWSGLPRACERGHYSVAKYIMDNYAIDVAVLNGKLGDQCEQNKFPSIKKMIIERGATICSYCRKHANEHEH